MTHYETLDIAQDATQEEIKAAYKKAAQASHPDREGGDVEAFKAVAAAYAILRDEGRREIYDRANCSDEEMQEVWLQQTIDSAIESALHGLARSVSLGHYHNLPNLLGAALGAL